MGPYPDSEGSNHCVCFQTSCSGCRQPKTLGSGVLCTVALEAGKVSYQGCTKEGVTPTGEEEVQGESGGSSAPGCMKLLI